jgi:hypothetical protein
MAPIESAPPTIAQPVTALFFASFAVTTLLLVLTEHFISASAGVAAYAVAWWLVRHA